jgi:hypothetical protein
MKSIALPLGILALLGTNVPPLADGPMKLAMLASTIVWFVTAPMWMKES